MSEFMPATVAGRATPFKDRPGDSRGPPAYRSGSNRRNRQMAVEIEQFMCRTDNFGVLMHDPESGETVIIDAPEAAPILAAIERTGWRPTALWITHHHGDHVAANLALKQKFGLSIIGPRAEAAKIPGIDQEVAGGDRLRLGAETVAVIDPPGHTAGHISYHLPRSGVAFVGDTLFAI